MKTIYLLLAATIFLFYGCTKVAGGTGDGVTTGLIEGCFTKMHLTLEDTIVTQGDDVRIYASEPYGIYRWRGPNQFNYDNTEGGGENFVTIPSIRLSEAGWYYCTGSGGFECNQVTDSIYVNVRYQQGTPSCSLTNNTITNTIGLPDMHNVSASETFSGQVTVSASAGFGYPEVYMYFNTAAEPKDGIYITKDFDVFDGDDDANAVSITCLSFYNFVSLNGQKVYVSHVNGKLTVSFCGVNISGEGFSGQISGEVTVR